MLADAFGARGREGVAHCGEWASTHLLHCAVAQVSRALPCSHDAIPPVHEQVVDALRCWAAMVVFVAVFLLSVLCERLCG